MDRTGHCFTGQLFAHTSDLEEDAAWLDVGYPPLGGSLTGTHTSFCRLLGQGAVGVDVDPHLSTTLDVTGHRDTSGLDLTVRDISTGRRLDAVLTEGHRGATGSVPTALGVVLLTELNFARNQHGYSAPPAATAAGSAAGAPAGPRRGAPRSGRCER